MLMKLTQGVNLIILHHFASTFFANIFSPKSCKALLYEKRGRTMLMKLTEVFILHTKMSNYLRIILKI